MEMDLENLKRMMKAEHYTRFYDFKKKVIEISMREIDDYTDLKVESTLKKKGKQFTSIVFQIGTKEELSERLLTWQKINQQITPRRDPKKTITVEAREVTDLEDDSES